jgi:hypothetical protein
VSQLRLLQQGLTLQGPITQLVREEVTNAGTGTTFLLAENGLFLIRRPAVEQNQRRREQEWFWQHNGD